MIGNVPQRAQEPLCDAGEFVVECHSYKGKTYPHSGPQRVHERVVRCRDCRALDLADIDWRDWCYCHNFSEYVEPDGFCAWGERGAE